MPSCCAPTSCSSPAARRCATRRSCSPATSPRSACAPGPDEALEELARYSSVPVINMLTAAPPPLPGARRPADAAPGLRRAGRAARSPTSATATTSPARWRSSARSPACTSRSPRRRATRSRTTWRRRPGRPGQSACTRDPREAVAGAAAVYTDVWVSMGDEEHRRGAGAATSPPTASTTRCSTRPRRGRSRCTTCRRTPARRSPPRCSTARASASGTRRRTAATRRRRCSSCWSASG